MKSEHVCFTTNVKLRTSWLKYSNLSLMFIVLCCTGVTCLAQTDRGTVSGTVTDSSGAGITGAKVTITNAAMGKQNSTVTTGAGDYAIPELVAGEYSVTVVAPGFSALVPNGITHSCGEPAPVDLKLRVGEVTGNVTVTERSPLVQDGCPN